MMNRVGATCWTLVCGMALLISCGSTDSHGGFVAPPDEGGAGGVSHRGGAGGKANTAGTSGRSEDAGSAGASESTLAPELKITTPRPASDPNVDPVLIDDQVTVLCKVTQSTESGAAAVDPSTVRIAMLDSKGKELKSLSGTTTENADEYSASFVLVEVPTGAVSFACSASDLQQHGASTSIDTLVDHGPEIDIIQPLKSSAHNVLTPLAVEFDTAPVLLTKGDKQADETAVSLTVYGIDIKTTNAGGGKYKATVDFQGTDFANPPTGIVPVLLTATNNRKTPGKATQSISYSIVLDGTGPTISMVSPMTQAVVGPASVLKFTAVDAGAGLDNSTVTVKLNDTPFVYSATNGKWSVDSSSTFTFQLGAEVKSQKGDPQVTVNISASDKAGNTGKAAAIFNLDNQPPIVDMDPPNLYESIIDPQDPTKKQCSNYFDPVGTQAADDLQTITNFGLFRAVVYDTTNTKAGQTVFFFSLTNRESVQVFVQWDRTSPLLADTDGPNGVVDGICDEIWTGTVPHQKKPTDKPIPFDALHVIAPNSNRGLVTYPEPKVSIPLTQLCTGGVASTAPGLCKNNASDMSVVIHHGVGSTEPVIYAIDPVDSNDVESCTGQPWDVSTAISKVAGEQGYLGWVCVATRAVDNVGNVGVSAPLRLCLDDGSTRIAATTCRRLPALTPARRRRTSIRPRSTTERTAHVDGVRVAPWPARTVRPALHHFIRQRRHTDMNMIVVVGVVVRG